MENLTKTNKNVKNDDWIGIVVLLGAFLFFALCLTIINTNTQGGDMGNNFGISCIAVILVAIVIISLNALKNWFNRI